jgi:FkbM family methyltransferase
LQIRNSIIPNAKFYWPFKKEEMNESILRNASLAKKGGTTRSEQLSLFFSLLRNEWKAKRYSQKNKECSESFLKYKVWGYNQFILGDLYKEVFLSKEYYFETATPEPLIIDCGASIGMSILYFKDLFPKSKIVAFEPNPHAYKLLKKNLDVNHIIDVELHPVALSDRQGEISFFIASDDVGTLLGSARADRGGGTELRVTADRLSHYISTMDKIDLIKIDVEGSEQLIINDLIGSSCIHKADQYIIEYHHHINNDHSMLSEFLKKFEINGFDYNIRASFDKLGSFQDILIHLYKKNKLLP